MAALAAFSAAITVWAFRFFSVHFRTIATVWCLIADAITSHFPVVVTALGQYNLASFPDISQFPVPRTWKEFFQFEALELMAGFSIQFDATINQRVIHTLGYAIMIPSMDMKTTSPSGYVAISTTPVVFPDNSMLCLTVEPSIDHPWDVPSGYQGTGVTGIVSLVYAPAA